MPQTYWKWYFQNTRRDPKRDRCAYWVVSPKDREYGSAAETAWRSQAQANPPGDLDKVLLSSRLQRSCLCRGRGEWGEATSPRPAQAHWTPSE